ncbi:Sterile alpha motif domain-containing protein [Actinidia chinensis var. chinensis]|uniref:Sterile alpha motif domain-containing protein n=1 Tax=Actinidia chinensis var. chinensis TaxID=1590841 RepID=A0A2R6PZT0_ACTCC|nr:Sterile alpha motif domain-containing protein [Actinidia chinensis var. chinensis]
MGEQRQGFHFRLPWLQTSRAPRPRPRRRSRTPTAPTPTPTTPTPTSESRAPTQPTTTTPAQRPPFRPPGLAPAQPPPPPQPQASAKTESQPSSPSSATTRSRVSSQPPSPSRAGIQSRGAKADRQPLSTSGTVAETQTASQTAPQPQTPPKSASLPSSPSLTPAQAQSAAEAVTQPPLPSEELQAATQEEGVEPPPGSPHSQTSSQITFQPNETPAQPSEASRPVTASAALQAHAPTQKPNSSLVSAETKPLQESDGNPEKTPEQKEIMQERGNKQKINDVTEEPKQRTITELPTAALGSKVPTKMHHEFDEEQQKKLLEKEEVISRKETIATSSYNGEQTKTVFSQQRDKNTVSESHHKPIMTGGEQAPLHEEIRGIISKFVHKMATQQPNQPLDESPVSFITLADENRGALMLLGSESAKRERAIHIRRDYKVNLDESNEATTDGEGSSKGRSTKDSKTEEDQASKAYINSNVQGINNTIVFDSSITKRNPGVKLVHSRNLPEPVEPNGRRESLEIHKAEFNVTRAQRLTYEPRSEEDA